MGFCAFLYGPIFGDGVYADVASFCGNFSVVVFLRVFILDGVLFNDFVAGGGAMFLRGDEEEKEGALLKFSGFF